MVISPSDLFRLEVELEVLHSADGRWEAKLYVDLPDGRRKRISVYANSERDALDELNRLRDQQRRGIPVATTTLTVAEYMTYWLAHVAEPSIRRTTYATYEGDVRLHIIPGIGKRKLKSLQAADVRLWLTQLAKDSVSVLRSGQGREPKIAEVLREGRAGLLPGCSVVELDPPHPQSPAGGSARRGR